MAHPEDGAAEQIGSGAETNSVMYNRRGDLSCHQDCDSHRLHGDHRRDCDNCHSCEGFNQICNDQGTTLMPILLL